MRVVGDKEGKGSKGHGIGNESGMQQRGGWQGLRASDGNKGDGDDVGNGDSDKAGGQ